MLRPVALWLLAAPLTAAATPAAALSLEATFDAHARAVLQDDAQARMRLRNSLLTAATAVPADIALKVEGRAFQNLDEAPGKPIADALQARRQTIHCRATGSDVEQIGTLDVGTVAYRCVLPDMSGHFETYRRSRSRMKDGQGDPMQDASFRRAYATALRNAPDGVHEGRMRFIRTGDEPWDSIEMLYFDADIRRRLMPMHAWDERLNPAPPPGARHARSSNLMSSPTWR